MQNQETLISLFEEAAQNYSAATAIQHREESLSYEELNQRANQLAVFLRERGVKKDNLVAICAERGIAFIVAVLGTIKAGGAYVTLDPSDPPQHLETILNDTHAVFILTTQTALLSLPETTATIAVLDEFYFRFKGYSKENLPNFSHKNDLATVIYTSGSGGKPKGVMIEHHSIINLIMNQQYIKLDNNLSMLHLSSVSFDTITFEIWGALLHGLKLIVVDQDTILETSELKDFIKETSRACICVTASFFERLVTEDQSIFKGCEYVIFGREPCNLTILKNYISKNEKTNLPAHLFNAYGLTECTTFSTMYEIPQSEDIKSISIGQPITNVKVGLFDEKHRPVKDGKLGELNISGEGVARGYLNEPSLTNEKFFTKEDVRYYRTGDIGKTNSANIEFQGRLDNQLKIYGHRVEPAEVEAMLKSLPDVENAYVTLEVSEKAGKELVAYLTLPKNLIRVFYKGPCQLRWSDEELEEVEVLDLSQGGICISGSNRKTVFREKINVLLPELLGQKEIQGEAIWQSKKLLGIHFVAPDEKINKFIDNYYSEKVTVIEQRRNFRTILERKLPEYMIPNRFIVLSNMPIKRFGKIDADALKKIYQTKKDEMAHQKRTESVRSEAEDIMIKLWREVLAVPDIGKEDNFFALGGHSLLATKILTKLKENYHATISFHDFFSNPMLSQLAVLIGNELEKSHYEPIQTVARNRRIPLSFGQDKIWHVSELIPAIPLYNLPNMIRLSGKIIMNAVQNSLTLLVERHEILRTVFAANKEGIPYQRIQTDIKLPLTIINLSSTSFIDEGTLENMVRQDIEKPFDMNAGFLFRVLMIQLKPDEYALVITLHQSIADEWSLGIMHRDLSELYNAYLEQREPSLPKLSIQYGDYAIWQREEANALKPEYVQKLKFWKDKLKGAELNPLLPLDFSRPDKPSYQAGIANFKIDKKLSSSLKGLSINAKCTLFMTLFSAFVILINQLSGKKDVTVGTPIANRNRMEIDNLIGLFANTLPIRIEIDDDIGFMKLLNDVKRILLDCYEHQDLPFEKIAEELVLNKNINFHPIVQVMFTLQNPSLPKPHFSALQTKAVNDITLPYCLYDFYMSLEEDEDEIKGTILYSKDLFREETVLHWIQKWQYLLQLISSNHQIKLNELGLF